MIGGRFHPRASSSATCSLRRTTLIVFTPRTWAPPQTIRVTTVQEQAAVVSLQLAHVHGALQLLAQLSRCTAPCALESAERSGQPLSWRSRAEERIANPVTGVGETRSLHR